MATRPRRFLPRADLPAVRVPLLAGLFAVTGAAPAAAQQCTPDYRDLASAVYAQVLEYGSTHHGIDHWSGQFQAGATVKQMVHAHMHWGGYHERFVNGKDSRTILTYLYRHILAREPDDGAWGWIGVGETSGWGAVVDGLMGSAEYNTRFGEHVVPGAPVTAWDCARANVGVAAHHDGYRDQTQGGRTWPSARRRT